MKQEIKRQMQSEDVKYLPSEIMLNILLRIPVQTVIRCKCVCKAWHDLLETDEFVKSHLSKSVPGLAVYLWGRKQYRIVEFVDEHRLNIVFSIDLPFLGSVFIVHSSANGLLFVCDRSSDDLFVCNPITQEYIRLPSPLEPSSRHAIHAFGVSKMSGQYKVVRMTVDAVDCQVYTLGTGSWRKIEFDDQLGHRRNVEAFLNGNLHWLAYNKESNDDLICCLDLETERFSTFCPPDGGYYNYRILSVLGDYLCVCNTHVDSSYSNIWLMKYYGDEKSWTNEFRIYTGSFHNHYHWPIKVFNNGDILLQCRGNILLYSSKKHHCASIQRVDLFNDVLSCAIIYAPSFLSLKTFAMENVSSF